MKATLKPYERKYIENKQLVENFVSGKSNFETFVDVLRKYETANVEISDEIGTIGISVGKKTNKGFISYLHTYTNSPSVAFGNWNKAEPTFGIKDKNYRSDVVLCSINLACIENLEVAVRQDGYGDVYDFSFTYRDVGLDYDFVIKIRK